jgi:hypothetical protein
MQGHLKSVIEVPGEIACRGYDPAAIQEQPLKPTS